jgi:hypothetical protein
VLVLWMREPGGGDASWAKRFFSRLSLVGLIIVLLVSLDYELSMRDLGLPGGLTTSSGRFETRACESVW